MLGKKKKKINSNNLQQINNEKINSTKKIHMKKI